MATKLERYAEELVDEVLEGNVGIQDAIDQLNAKLEVYDRVKVQRDRLLAARRALLGSGNKVTGEGGSRTTSDEVAQWLAANGPATNAEMAQALSTTEAVIRGHMNRGKDRFEKTADGKWQTVDAERAADTDDDEGDED